MTIAVDEILSLFFKTLHMNANNKVPVGDGQCHVRNSLQY
jgi:hypothetical protein